MAKEAHEIEWSRAQEIVLSVDLVKAAKQQLRFLAVVDSIHCLHDGPALHHAIYRYEHCWLPLLAKHMESPVNTEPLVVPLDCEWIWHCHRLNPVQYKIDCEEIYGRILDNKNVLSTTEGTCTGETQKLWNHMYPTEPYHFEQNCHPLRTANSPNMWPHTSIKYDLVAAVKRQSPFFRKVSKSVFNNDHYLGEGVARYKAFLHLVKRNEERSVPTYDIDLMWHSHQLNPLSYCEDLTAIFGGILDHNDHISDNPVNNKHKIGLAQTTKLWEDTYGQKYLIAGALLKDDDLAARCSCYCIIGIKRCDSECSQAVTLCAK
ncbi:glycine-rich domain-containing protein 1-like [Punica granatum]|uniref:Uncharacterized protein n=2 Tax=Punica granatum TaxID=22663 RepID=A0A218XWQ9_PUNGR|nr:glycine-rich domain-containing protein 1-like [Punica granatum]OWM89413.1 hypothetical protein CDL15_Pgr024161 [Punica granatum]PKI62521.1 hypothetical protein CRG98_017145 [Punica granatum]